MIFVTGGTGLVGSHVLLNLASKSKKFKALKRRHSSLDVCKRVFSYYKADDLFIKLNWVDGDLNDISSLQELMQGCTLLLHCAGLVSFSPFDFKRLKKVNIEGTANVMNIALTSGIEKVGYISSIATLNQESTSLIDEECHFKLTKTASSYAYSKYYAEQEVWRASAEGLDVVIINPSVVLGPGDWTRGSSQIFEKIYKGLKFYTNGSTGYVDVSDVAEILIQLLFSNVKNERFIVSGTNLKYRDCFDRIALALGKQKATIKITPFLKEVAWRVEAIKSFFTAKNPLITKETSRSAMSTKTFSNAKIKKTLGFQFTDIDITISKYANWFLSDQV